MLVKLLRFAAAFIIGIALWWYVTPLYNVLLAETAERLVQLDSRLSQVNLTADGREIIVTNVPKGRIPADQLTYNLVLFLALYATIPLLKRTYNVFAVCLVILVLTHILAVALSVEATYATTFGDWSETRYGDNEQDFWTAAEYLYRLAGMFGISFALWWVARSRVVPPVSFAIPGRERPPLNEQSTRHRR